MKMLFIKFKDESVLFYMHYKAKKKKKKFIGKKTPFKV